MSAAADLSTDYLGLHLSSPLVASSSPLTGTLDGLRRLEDAGAAAAVLPSLFEEELTHGGTEVDRLLETGPERLRELTSGLQEWLEEHEYVSVAQPRGSVAQRAGTDPTAYERGNYLKTLRSWSSRC